MAEYEVTQAAEDGYDNYVVFNYRADLAQAASPVEIDMGGEWDATPIQVADGKHDEKEIAHLLMSWVGGDWYSMDRPITVKEIDNG
jgi:hypothetical protein